MKRVLLLSAVLGTFLVGAMVAQLQAQNVGPLGVAQSVSVQDSGTACSVANTCAVFQQGVFGAPALLFGVSGTWNMTLTFEGSNDGANWTAIRITPLATGTVATTTTANGLFGVLNPGFTMVRIRATTVSSGTAVIVCTRGGGF